MVVKDGDDLKMKVLSLLNDKEQQQLIYRKASELLKKDIGLEKCRKVIGNLSIQYIKERSYNYLLISFI